MKYQRIFSIGLALIGILAISLAAFAAQEQSHRARVEAAIGSGFTYQGRLKDEDGNPTTSTCDFTFSLWDAESGGTQVGDDSTVNDVAVTDGYFDTIVNAGGEFGTDAFAGEERWLAIDVQCEGDLAMIPLSPRQLLSAAPYASFSQGTAWSGITGAPDLQRRVTGTCTAGNAIREVAADGSVTCEPTSGSAHDHWGQSWSGTGTGLTLSGGSVGLQSGGSSTGVEAIGGTYGVYGDGPNGIYGTSDHDNGIGVAGYASGNNGNGVFGQAGILNGAGVYANHEIISGTALAIGQGSIKVTGAGEGTDTPVFQHKVQTGAGGNVCSIQNYATVLDHPLTNGHADAILLITPNWGPASGGALVRQPYGVYYDDTDQCGFGAGRWVIYGYGVDPDPPLALVDDQLFNVMVVLP